MGNAKISQLVKSLGKYDLAIFPSESVDRIEKNIFEKESKFFIGCLNLNEIVEESDKWAREQNLSFWRKT